MCNVFCMDIWHSHKGFPILNFQSVELISREALLWACVLTGKPVPMFVLGALQWVLALHHGVSTSSQGPFLKGFPRDQEPHGQPSVS